MSEDPLPALQRLIAEVSEAGKYFEKWDDELTRLIAELIHHAKFTYRNEVDLHRGLNALFVMAGLRVTPEAVLAAGERIDFIIGPIGIEVKIKGSTPQVLAQLQRYADTGKVRKLILVTSRAKHRSLAGTVLTGPTRQIPVTLARLPWM